MALIDPFSSVQRVYTRQLTCGKGQRGRRAPPYHTSLALDSSVGS